MSEVGRNEDPDSVNQVDAQEQRDKAAAQADSEEQREFYEDQTGEEDLSQGYGH